MDLAAATAEFLLKAYRARDVSPVEVVNAHLARIDEHNTKVNALVTVAADEALAAARGAEQAYISEKAGLLSGVPVAVKDTEYTRGIRTMSGSAAYRDLLPEADSIVVERLRAAGAVILAKTKRAGIGDGFRERQPGERLLQQSLGSPQDLPAAPAEALRPRSPRR